MAKMKLRNIPGWNALEYAFAAVLWTFLNALPIEWGSWIARRFGDLMLAAAPKRKRLALQNLDIAYGDSLSRSAKEKIAAESFRNFAVSVFEFFRIPRTLRDAHRHFTFEGTEHMDAAFKKGKGVLFVISHTGSWENLAFLPYLRGYPCSVIVRPLKNPRLYAQIQKLRMATQLRPIDKNKSVREIFSRLRHNELVAILIDQWAGPEGIWIDIFGRPTSTTSIPAKLARKTGAALIPGLCIRTSPGNYRIVIRPEIPLAEGEDYERSTTQRLNDWLEKEIRQCPDQWIWGHQRWKDYSRYSPTPK